MIDAHVHLWRIGENGCTWPPPALAAIHRDIDLAEYRAIPDAGAMEGVILVQSQEDAADTGWLLSVAADPFVLGVVGWVDLSAAAAPARIRDLTAQPKLRGLRPMVQDRAGDWYDDPALDPAWAVMTECGLVLDALVRPAHLSSLDRLAARFPDLRILVDHLAKPDLGDNGEWAHAMRTIAARPGVSCKLSGLLTELRPGQHLGLVEDAIGVALDAFGPERLVWGSDWPVLTLAGDLGGWLALARRAVPDRHHEAVFGGNARRIYGLES